MITLPEYLNHQHHLIEANIDRLMNGLADLEQDPELPDTLGQRALLEIQFQHLALIEDLQKNAGDPAAVLNMCAARLMLATMVHERARNHDHDHNGRHCDAWWDSLGRLSYLNKITHHIVNIVRYGVIKEPG